MSASKQPDEPVLENVAEQIRQLKSSALALPDILKLADVMVVSMRSFYDQVDAATYQELSNISAFINNARSEIGRLQPNNLREKHFPEAGKELEAIVQTTEAATNTIMEHAELIMEADPENAEAYQETVQASIMEIFQACSFQDITGQRISKIVNTLVHIENRIGALADVLGSTIEEVPAEETPEEKRNRELILNGPALDGEGIDQADVDELMGEGASQNDIDALFD